MASHAVALALYTLPSPGRTQPLSPSFRTTPSKNPNKSPPKSPTPLVVVAREKRHVSGPMKFVVGEKPRATALEGAEMWRKKFAGEERWKGVVAGIREFAREDAMRIEGEVGEDRTEKKQDVTISPTPWPGQRTRPKTLFGDSLITPRARWDVPTQGPITPLSPTTTGNAFGPGGFWATLTSQPSTPVPSTPITALHIPVQPFSPTLPTDPESLAAYTAVRAEVDAMALKLCASRLSIYSSGSSESAAGLVHPSMVKARDELAAAEFVLHGWCKRIKLGEAIDPALPEKMAKWADEERAVVARYSITDWDMDGWIKASPQTGDISTILDAQRDALFMLRTRRKSRIGEQAVKFAWAARIVEDVERKVEEWDGGSVASEDSAGYDYGNFLRALKREGSDGSSLSMADERWSDPELKRWRSRSTTLGTNNSVPSLRIRESASPKQSGKSIEETRGEKDGISLHGCFEHGAGIRTSTPPSTATSTPSPPPIPRTSTLPPPHQRHRRHRHARSKNLSITTTATPPSFDHPSSSDPSALHTATNLSSSDPTHLHLHLHPLPTTTTNEDEHEPSHPPLTPQDRDFRHQGPSHADLSAWAQELSKLRRSGESDRGASTEEKESGTNALDRGKKGVLHPAFRNRGASDGSNGSDESWRCTGAVGVERGNVPPLLLRDAKTRGRGQEEKKKKVVVEDEKEHEERTPAQRSSSHASFTQQEEEEWVLELQRMESREVRRQKGV